MITIAPGLLGTSWKKTIYRVYRFRAIRRGSPATEGESVSRIIDTIEKRERREVDQSKDIPYIDNYGFPKKFSIYVRLGV